MNISSSKTESVKQNNLESLKSSMTTWHPFGNLKVFCNGFIVVNPIRPWVWLMEVYVIAVTVVFLCERSHYNTTVTTVGLSLSALSLLFCLCVTLTNPGVLKKPSYEEALSNALQVSKSTGKSAFIRRFQIENGRSVQYFYCSRCQVFRPPFSCHCHICDCCIAKWDHHCPVIGVCVSQRNFFIVHAMIFSLAMTWLFLFFTSLYVISAVGQRQNTETISISESLTFIMILAGTIGSCVLPPILGIVYNCFKGLN